MKEEFVVAEETREMVGTKIVDDGECVILKDIDEIDGISEAEYIIPKSDIPKLIEGLRLFTENKSMSREEFIAAIKHIGWIYYQITAGQPYNEVANEDQTKSLIDGIQYADAHTDMTPEQNHENWMKTKISQGWTYGPIKDFKKKTHPDLIPFDQLPEIEKGKDTADHIGHRLASKLWDLMEGRV